MQIGGWSRADISIRRVGQGTSELLCSRGGKTWFTCYPSPRELRELAQECNTVADAIAGDDPCQESVEEPELPEELNDKLFRVELRDRFNLLRSYVKWLAGHTVNFMGEVAKDFEALERRVTRLEKHDANMRGDVDGLLEREGSRHPGLE